MHSELFHLEYNKLKIDLHELKAWLKEFLECADTLWQTLNICDKDQRKIYLKDVFVSKLNSFK